MLICHVARHIEAEGLGMAPRRVTEWHLMPWGQIALPIDAPPTSCTVPPQLCIPFAASVPGIPLLAGTQHACVERRASGPHVSVPACPRQ